jgi:hydroxymethylpyrimidine pyrophosphatase-like HAD family hydrolase
MERVFQNIKIAVDFDGTIVDHEYPEIGKEKLFVFETLKSLQKQGCRLILWTIRTGRELDEAVEFCRQKGVEFYAVNKNYPEEKFEEDVARKIEADIYIDDRNIGGFYEWHRVWEMLNPEIEHERLTIEKQYSKPGLSFNSLIQRFLKLKKKS